MLGSNEPSSVEVGITVLLGYTLTRSYKRYVDSFGLTGNERVLDYGSGSGRISRHIAQRLSQDHGHLTCVDVSRVWMDTIRKRLQKYPNVDFQLGDIDTLGLPDASYDVGVMHFVLHHIDSSVRQKKIDALSRTLKIGGRLFVREPTRVEHGTPVDEIRQVLTAAGLHERESKTERSLVLGRVYNGVFEKTAAR